MTAAPAPAQPRPPAPPRPRRRINDPLTEDGILILCRLAALGVTYRVLAEAFQIPSPKLRRLVRRDSWKVEIADTPGFMR